jgi:hypothetical protein
MKSVSEVHFRVCDHGLFLPIARRLARDAGKVTYWSPHELAFPTVKSFIGDGFPDFERVESPWQDFDSVDCWCFPDVGFSHLQAEIKGQGRPVWGAGGADRIEISRTAFIQALEKTKLPVAKHITVRGITSLKEHLYGQANKWVKISRFRGDFETFHWRSREDDANRLDAVAVKFGPFREEILFYVFDPIDTEIEDGCDTWCINGAYPKLVIHGMESKDKAYLGTWQKYSELPEELRIVSDSFSPILSSFDYRSFFSTEVRITKDGESYFIDPTCFSDDTEILTNQGWKRFQDLNRNERVCTLNPETSQIEYHQPEGYVSYHYDGDMVRITNRKCDLDLMVTPHHSVWGVAKHKTTLEEFRADKIPYSLSIPRSGIWEGMEGVDFTIPDYSKTWHSGKGRGIDKTFSRARLRMGMDVWLRFLALYLSEGSCGKWQTTIHQTKHKDQVRDILKATSFRWKEHAKGFTCSDVQLRTSLAGLGNRYTKAIPAFVGQLRPRQINLFLDAYCLGDGHIENGNRVISTPSKQTADDIQELFLKSGSVASVVVRHFTGKPCGLSNGKYTCHHDSYQIRERREFLDFYVEGWKNPRHKQYLSHVPYVGMVHDVTVTNHIIYVRRNGKCCWSGNCRAGSPPSQVITEMIGNYAQVIWGGANGELVEPEPSAKFGVQAIVCSSGDRREWRGIEVRDELDRWIKCPNCVWMDGRIWTPPDPDADGKEIGWLVGIGDQMGEAIRHLQHNASLLPDGATCEFTALADLIKEIEKAEASGMEFTDQPIPEPEIVLEDK